MGKEKQRDGERLWLVAKFLSFFPEFFIFFPNRCTQYGIPIPTSFPCTPSFYTKIGLHIPESLVEEVTSIDARKTDYEDEVNSCSSLEDILSVGSLVDSGKITNQESLGAFRVHFFARLLQMLVFHNFTSQWYATDAHYEINNLSDDPFFFFFR